MGYGILATSLKPSCNEKGTVETALSELAKADDLVSLAVPCLGNDVEETGDIEDVTTLSEATVLIGTEYVTLGVGQRRDKV